jgi:hypothetical protein
MGFGSCAAGRSGSIPLAVLDGYHRKATHRTRDSWECGIGFLPEERRALNAASQPPGQTPAGPGLMKSGLYWGISSWTMRRFLLRDGFVMAAAGTTPPGPPFSILFGTVICYILAVAQKI